MPNVLHPQSRLAPLALLVSLAAAGPAAGQVELESFVSASSTDEIFEPFDIAEDYEEDTSDVAGEMARARATTCLDPCVVIPPIEGEAQADAVTEFGENQVDVYSESWSDGSNSSYHDEAGATSRWADEITLSSEGPIPGGSVRATFRLQGSWQNLACFTFVAFLYDPATIQPGCVGDCCSCPSVASLAGVSNLDESNCEPLLPYGPGGASFPGLFPDFNQEDGDVDVTTSVELPLILDSPLRFGAGLSGGTAALDFSTLESGVTAVVESLEVPAGVQVSSAAGALAAYHVNAPEPAAGTSAATAAALLAWLCGRRRALRG